MKTVWVGFPPGLREQVEPHIDAHLHRVPAWCERLEIRFNEEEEDYATSTVHHAYREARVDITPIFFSLDTDQREITVVHELSHILHAPLDTVVARIISRLPEALQQWAEDDYEEACEALVSDLAHIATR